MKQRLLWSTLLIGFFLSVVVFYTKPLASILLAQDVKADWLYQYGQRHHLKEFHLFNIRHNEIGSVKWLNSAHVLALTSADYSFELAKIYLQREEISHSEYWYKHAKKLGHHQASSDLAALYYTHGQRDHAWQILKEIAAPNDQELRYLIELALEKSKVDLAQLYHRKLMAQAGETLKQPISNFIDKLSAYKVFDRELSFPLLGCEKPVNTFATRLTDLQKLEDLVNKISQTSVGQAFCFAKPRYIPLKQLNCDHHLSERINCQNISKEPNRYQLFLVPSGGANVNETVLFLDSKDTLAVLRHELLHFLGFIDEYPLPGNHAKCLADTPSAIAHNLILASKNAIDASQLEQVKKSLLNIIPWADLIKPSTPLFHQKNGLWYIGTPKAFDDQLGLFHAATCNGKRKGFNDQVVEVQAFKPVKGLTSLEYFDIPLPKSYLEIFHLAPNKFLMTTTD